MDAIAKAWLMKSCRANLWRMPSWYELDDLLQEGYECYYESRKRYPGATEPRHIMKLFQLIFNCRMHDLSNAKRKQPDHPNCNGSTDSVATIEQLAAVVGMIMLPQVSMLPPILKEVVAVIEGMSEDEFTATVGRAEKSKRPALRGRALREAARPEYVRTSAGGRQTFNAVVCEKLGVNPRWDLVGALRKHLEACT